MALNRRSFVQRVLMALGATGSSVPLKANSLGPAVNPSGMDDSAQAGQAAGYIRPETIETIHRSFDVVVVGGGISGTCAAISAARNGAKTALVHERSTLGGNSSSEVRLYPEDTCGFSPWIKESGILDEIAVEERARNWEPYIEGMMNSHWDLVLYEWVKREKNLSLFLNTTMREVVMRDARHIQAIHAPQLGTEREFILSAPLFIDATGDGVLGFRAGADFRWGKEVRSEFHEALAPTEPASGLMGNTLFFRARDTGHPVIFKKPDWAAEFDTEADLTDRGHGHFECGYWWIEVGTPLHPIKDNEEIRDEALRQLLGVWDHIKNHCTADGVREKAKNFALEFVGFWPYKRESRRILGDYTLTEKDVRDPSIHPDDIAYGAWGIDIHVPGGIHERRVPPYPEPRSDENFKQRGTIPYGIPLRSCYSRNVQNLLTAGRPIGASYVAFASSRVLPTGAIVGQGVGAAAALCTKYGCTPKTLAADHADELQQLLLRQDASIPGVENEDVNDLARRAQVTASSEAPLRFPESETFHKAALGLGQVFPVSTDRVDGVELLLQSTSSQPQQVTLSLRRVEHAWDLRPSPVIATATTTVPAGFKGYVQFPLRTRTKPGSLYFAFIDARPELAWAIHSDADGKPTQVPVGTTAADLPPGGFWRPFTHGRSLAIRVVPEQSPYTAQNVVRGTNRPDRWTNIFVSDAAQSLPAWIELKFPSPVKFNHVQITFDTDTSRRIPLPLFHYPECVRKYEIAVPQGGEWKTIVTEDGNYFRRRVHRFDAVTASRLRINVLETNGSAEARIYEVRVCNEKSEV
ncbi:MAG TPA: FAD-dependent oxidoreductase [Terracidiphilus sp.]|nr:FAD-dependent oxidoreductase [Terracidiphilus sp.]